MLFSTPHHWCEALAQYVRSLNTSCAQQYYTQRKRVYPRHKRL